MITDESVFLEHFGIKGMHWGYRKSPAEKAQTHDHRVKRAKEVGAVAAVATAAAGALYARKLLSKKGVNRLPKPNTPQWNFSAKGKDWIVQANDGHVFDIAVKTMMNPNR